EWEQLMVAPSLRPYVTGSAPNPFAGPSASPPLSLPTGRLPPYHPALNPVTAYQLARAHPAGWQAFGSYSRWLRSGAAGELGFTAGEDSGSGRLRLLGGMPLYIFPIAPPPTTYALPEPEPEVTERESQAYAGWTRGRTGADAPLLDVGQAPS